MIRVPSRQCAASDFCSLVLQNVVNARQDEQEADAQIRAEAAREQAAAAAGNATGSLQDWLWGGRTADDGSSLTGAIGYPIGFLSSDYLSSAVQGIVVKVADVLRTKWARRQVTGLPHQSHA